MASNNTSKTAHVMNLLSKNRGPSAEPAKPEAAAPQAEAAAPAEAAPQAETARTAPVAPIISSINADAAVSSQIKDALEAELQEAPARQAAPAAPPVQRTEEPPQQPPVQPEEPQAEEPPVQQPAEEPQPVEEEPPVQPEEPQAAEEAGEEPASYINVMQLLVEEKADEYMKMFGICCCDKCRVDVRAYALNHLPPKYVVLSQGERVPRLTVYESRFASDVTAQLIQACKKVMLTPHHTRADG